MCLLLYQTNFGSIPRVCWYIKPTLGQCSVFAGISNQHWVNAPCLLVYQTNIGSMPRVCCYIKPTLGQCPVFAGISNQHRLNDLSLLVMLPPNKGHSPNAVSMLVQHRKREGV